MKNLVRIGLALLITVGLFLGIQAYQRSQYEEGLKKIQVIIYAPSNDTSKIDKTTILFEKTIHTNALTVGDLLDQMVLDKNISVTFAGNKSDPYGRYILGINTIISENSASGPWWLYNSSTNSSCVNAGYCSGIDQQAISDQDTFEFMFTSFIGD
jgi:hypothetical protein